MRRARGVLDLPDLPGERDDVGGVPDELDRGRLVEAGPTTVLNVPSPFTFTRLPVFGAAGAPGGPPPEHALRERVQIATAAELHVDEEWGTGGHLGGAR